MGFKHYGVKTGGIPVDYVKRFVDEYQIKTFIETGTAGGESVRAVAPLFEKCHTIEIVTGRPMELPENTQLHEGDSAKLLKEISSWYPDQYVFFWLDAHYSEPHPAPEGTNECPLLKEIESIKNQKAVILIDDARLFYGRPPWPCNPDNNWPRFMHVFDKLRQCFPDHLTTIVDDYILCCPIEMRNVHHWEWYERYNERFPSDEQRLKLSVQDSLVSFLKYVDFKTIPDEL